MDKTRIVWIPNTGEVTMLSESMWLLPSLLPSSSLLPFLVWLHLLCMAPLGYQSWLYLVLHKCLPSSYWLNFCVTILNSSEKESLWFIQSTCSFPESGGYDCHSVQLVLGRSRGLMASEVAMGGATSNQELDRDLDTGLSQKRISMSLKKTCRKYPRCQGRHGELWRRKDKVQVGRKRTCVPKEKWVQKWDPRWSQSQIQESSQLQRMPTHHGHQSITEIGWKLIHTWYPHMTTHITREV